jgi:hypothetical protein
MTEKNTDEVYRDRNLLACALVSKIGYPMAGWMPAPDTDSDEWAVVWAELPTGQVSWHVPRDMAEKLTPRNNEYSYDGHSREIKNDRLASWTHDGCPG